MRSSCAACNGTGFVEVDGDPSQQVTVKPCATCNYQAYERWASNHYEPNHWCMDCENVRRNRRTSA